VPVAVADPVATNNNQSFEWQPVDPLGKGAFQYLISTAAKDSSQNPLAQDFKEGFKVVSQGDGAGDGQAGVPTVVSFNPPDRAEKVPRETVIVVVFSEPMSIASVLNNFSLSKVNVVSGINNFQEEDVSGNAEACPDKKTFLFKPTSMLRRTEKYKIRVTKDAKSIAGIPLAEEATSDFETRSSIIGVSTFACPP